MIILVITVTILVLVVIGLSVYYTHLIVYPKQLSHKEVFKYEEENCTYEPQVFEHLTSKVVNIRSYMGYNLKAHLYLQKNPNRFVVFCHGITNNYESMMKYAQVYIRNGYSIMLYDHRNHGYSDRNYSSLGVYEKKDAKCCIDYLMKKFNHPIVGVHGESLGAATAMQLAAIDHRLAFCVEDCGYSNAFDLMKYRALEDYNKLLSFVTYTANLYIKIFFGFTFKDASVIHEINSIQCPVLFIHGEDDGYVPYYMVHELHEAFNGKKMLYTVPEARHAKSYVTNKTMYEGKIQTFLDQYVIM